jgi:hypothetical protein
VQIAVNGRAPRLPPRGTVCVALLAYSDVEGPGWTDTLQSLREQVGKSASLEDAAALVARELCTRFEQSTVLARVYALVPYGKLEPEVRVFVDGLAERTNQSGNVHPETPVLTLLGTHGKKKEWCDRHTSVGHRGIPLVSAAFVEAIPMVARLLKELGVELSCLDAAVDVNARRLVGGFNGVFYVEDAASARDAQGRLVIPAQDFVQEEGVKTVFGMGGFYPDGTLLTIIVFSRERLLKANVERLTSLITMFKGETFGVARAGKFFR